MNYQSGSTHEYPQQRGDRLIGLVEQFLHGVPVGSHLPRYLKGGVRVGAALLDEAVPDEYTEVVDECRLTRL